jgi:hypothetical protein
MMALQGDFDAGESAAYDEDEEFLAQVGMLFAIGLFEGVDEVVTRA